MQQLKNISMIIFSTLLGGVASYLYHPIMSHYLSILDFARFESLAGMFTILATITAGFSLYLTRAFSHEDREQMRQLYLSSERVFAIMGIGIYCIYLPCIWWIDSLLLIGSPLMVALIGLIIPISFFAIAPGSWLQWRGNFWFLSLYSILTSFGKLLFGWILVLIGFGIFGAIGGFIIAALVATLTIVVWIDRSIRWDRRTILLTHTQVIGLFYERRLELFHFFLLAFLLALFQNLDLILVNRLLDPAIAGKYALVSVMMKFVIFIALSVETVYYPRLSHPNWTRPDLAASVSLLITGSIVGYILFRFAGVYVLTAINPVFSEYQGLIPYFYAFCILFVWVSFWMKIAVAQGIYVVNIVSLIVGAMLLLYLHNQTMMTPELYIRSFMVTLMIVLIFSIIAVVNVLRRSDSRSHSIRHSRQ